MKEFERALLDARPPDLPTGEFRQALRRDLLAEDRHRRARGVRLAIGGLTTAVAVLAAVLVLFVARPSVPGKLNASLFESSATQNAATTAVSLPEAVAPGSFDAGFRPADVRQLLTRAGTSASTDQEWVDEWYEGQLDGSRVKALEDERLFAVRQFELTNGKRILVYTQIGGEPGIESLSNLSTARDF